MDIRQAKIQVIEAGLRLLDTGLVARTWGNVSCRISDTHFVITPSGQDYKSLQPEEIVAVSMEDLSYDGPVTPSGERGVHAEVYRQRPDAGFVIHTHQENASVISSLGLLSFPAGKAYPLLGGAVSCAPYALPGTKEIQAGVARLLPGLAGNALILQNHGAVLFGRDASEAFQAATDLEVASLDHLLDLARLRTGNPAISEGDLPALVEHLPELSSRLLPSASGQQEDALNRLLAQIRALLPAPLLLGPVSTPFVLAWSRTKRPLRPLLDDFAQIVGLRAVAPGSRPAALARALETGNGVFVPGLGALAAAGCEGDLAAIAMIIEKNCKAMICGLAAGGVRPLGRMDSRRLRRMYLHKYSLQFDRK